MPKTKLAKKVTISRDELLQRIEASEHKATQQIEASKVREEQVASYWADLEKRQAAIHSRRRAAYLRCARYPWLAPPDEEREPK